MTLGVNLEEIINEKSAERIETFRLFFLFRDNYGFVTFHNKKDAFDAIENGNADTSYPKVDLCFGGRRAFCKEKYADLGMCVKSVYCTFMNFRHINIGLFPVVVFSACYCT